MCNENETETVWFIKKLDGTLKGPFSSSQSAEVARLTENLDGTVVAGTKDGKQVLFG
jgi:hypothetical protein